MIWDSDLNPLSTKQNPSDKDLDQGAKKIMDQIEKVSKHFDKPVLFTEVGFRSVERPWLHPHEEANGQSYSEEAQARCYKALLANTKGRDWLLGLYWWKWPSYIPYAKERRTSFTPCGKSAGVILGHWYEETY